MNRARSVEMRERVPSRSGADVIVLLRLRPALFPRRLDWFPFVSRGGTYPSFGGVIYKSLQHERQVTVPLERYLSACTSYEHDLVEE